MTPNSDRDTGLGRSRLPGRTTAGNWSGISDGLVGPELKLDTDWVSESSSDTKLLQLSSSKASEATSGGENTGQRFLKSLQKRALLTSSRTQPPAGHGSQPTRPGNCRVLATMGT